jgi:hypothetical protein
MKKRLLFILCLVVGLGSVAFAQRGRTVTNADLEKYRQKREQSEKDLRENYEKLGFPSPEELQKDDAERRAEMEKVAARLRQEELLRQLAEAAALRSRVAALEGEVEGLQIGQANFYSSAAGVAVYPYGASIFGYPGYGYYGPRSYYKGYPSFKSGFGLRFNSGLRGTRGVYPIRINGPFSRGPVSRPRGGFKLSIGPR